MQTISQIRYAKARQLIDDCGTQRVFAEIIGKSQSQVGQFAGENPVKNIGNKIAREIEQAFNKPEGWLDTADADTTTAADPVACPAHYTSDPSGVECIDITRHRNFNIGNAFKYLWRAGLKDTATHIQDLKKAAWYIQDEINRLEKCK